MGTNDVGLKNPLDVKELYSAFEAADSIVLKKYISKLSGTNCIPIRDELKTIDVGDNVYLYRVGKIIYDKSENIQDKLTTVYSSILSLECCGLVMLINGNKNNAELFVGVVSRNYNSVNSKLVVIGKELSNQGKTLKNAFQGNFPGTELIAVNPSSEKNSPSKKDIITKSFKRSNYISAVSSIPAVRSEKTYDNQKFIQGLEKLIDTMKGKEYSALIIADAVSNEKVEAMCSDYEDIYSQLAPFKASSQTFSKQSSSTSSEGVIKGVTNTTNQSISKSLSHSTTTSKTHSNTFGLGVAMAFTPYGVGPSLSVNVSDTEGVGKAKTKGATKTEASGTAKSLTEQNSVTKALSESDGEGIQLNYENRAVKTLLDHIDEQIKRMRSCEDFGMFNTCAYFAAKDYDVAVAAAGAFKSITRGENSSVEASAVNVWKDPKEVERIKEYLTRFYHPEFMTVIDEGHQYPTNAAMFISGREMAYQMALPKKSVSGIPVLECAEFGREVTSLAADIGDITLGNIFHMYQEEGTEVKLNKQSLTSHTFITGSTGSGKSNTVYKLLDELVYNTDKDVKFLVVEPAKGEYKNVFGNRKDVSVYGTNMNISPLLRINPFSFPKEIHILEHLDRLVELFNVCWPMYAAMPAVLKSAVEKSYEDCGWNLVESANIYGDDLYPNFADVARNVKSIIDSSEYDTENKGAYKGSLLTRLNSLTNGINGLIFTDKEIPLEELFDRNVILDLSRVGSGETKSLIMGMVVLKLQEYRMTSSDMNAPLKHITVLEEAHNLLKRTSTEQTSESANLLGKSVEMISNAIAEMRTYGEGFIIADQSPSLLDMSVIRNTNTKIIMRIPDITDRELVGKAANLNESQIDELAKLPCGVAAVYQNEWIQPVLCKIRKFDTPDKSYVYQSGESPSAARSSTDMLAIADLLSKGTKIGREAILKDILPKLRDSGINASVQAAVAKQLENPPKEPRMTKLAPIMSALFPKVRSAVVDAYKDNLNAIEWTKRAEEVLINDLATELNDRTRCDIIQAIITDYVYNELGKKNDLQKWAENGGLR